MAEEEILKQEEINALLGDEEQGDSAGSNLGLPKLFDFSKQDKIIRGRMPTLEMIHDRFIRNYKLSIFNLLKKTIEIQPQQIKIMKFSEYVNTLPKPTSFNIVQIPPLKGNALFVLDGSLIFSFVESFFGGDGKSKSLLQEREFTPSELRITEKFLKIIFDDYQDAWNPIFEIQLECTGSEMNPGLAKIVSPSDSVVVCPFQMELEAGGGSFHVVFPHFMLEPIKHVLEAGVQSDRDDKDDRWGITIQQQVMHAKVELRCVLAEVPVSLKDIVNFKVGDILNFDMPEKATLLSDKTPLFRTKFGIHEGHYSVKILSHWRDEVE